MATAADAFDGTENPLATDWNTLGGGVGGIREGSGVASFPSGASDALSYWDSAVTAFSADHYAEVVIATADNDGGPAVRCSGSTAYSIDFTPSGASGIILKWNGTSATQLGTLTMGGVMTTGNTYRLSVTTVGGNAVLTPTRNGVASSPATLTDSSAPLLSGQPGMHIFNGPLTYASWAAADVGAAAGHPAGRRLAKSTPGLSPWAVRRM